MKAFLRIKFVFFCSNAQFWSYHKQFCLACICSFSDLFVTIPAVLMIACLAFKRVIGLSSSVRFQLISKSSKLHYTNQCIKS